MDALSWSGKEPSAIEQAFPELDPGAKPFGDRVLVQLRRSKVKTESGIQLVHETQDTNKFNEPVAKMIALGPLAYRKRDTLEIWQEGVWCQPGDFIRVPIFGGDRWEKPIPGTSDPVEYVMFALFKDFEVTAGITENPLLVKAYV